MAFNWGNALAGGTAAGTAGLAAGPWGSLAAIPGFIAGGFTGGNSQNPANPQQASGKMRTIGGAPSGNPLSGYDAYNTQLSRFNPEQESALSQILQQGLGNSNFQGIEDRARKDFATNTIPSIAERFTSFGNSQRSSAFQGALGSAGADLESQLAALRGQYGMQQLQLGLQPQYENIYTPQQSGLAQNLAAESPKYLELIGKLLASYQGNKLGGGQ